MSPGWHVGQIGFGVPAGPDFVTYSGTTTSFEIVLLPTGAEVGDLLLLSVSSQFELNSVVSNSGLGSAWTEIRTDFAHGSLDVIQMPLWYHVMEPGDVNAKVTWRSGNRYALSLIAYSGIDQTTPIDAHGATVSTVDGTTSTAPSVTTSTSGCRIVECFGTIPGVDDIIGPATIHTNVQEPGSFYANSVSDQVQGGAGATGTHTATGGNGGSARGWVAQTVALKPG